MLKIITLAALATFTNGCVYSLHDVYVSNFGPAEGKPVEARSEQHTIMGFVSDTGFVEEARISLLAQCSGGRLENITTQYSTDLGFFSWTNKVLMKGTCVETGAI